MPKYRKLIDRFYHLLAFFFLLFCYEQGVAQELPPVENFSATSYHSANQNWAISQSKDKRIYVANNEGLLEFNGANWRLYPSPNQTIFRSVKVIDDKIFTGCYMDFGFWERTNLGQLKYTSIAEEQGIDLIEDEEFWQIAGIENWVVFQSLNRIYIYDKQQNNIQIIESDHTVNKIFEVDETIYFQRLNRGVFTIEGGKEVLFLDAPDLIDLEIVSIFKEENKLLILTRHNGFFCWDKGQLKQLESPLSRFSVYSAIRLSNKGYAIGTISNGLIYLSKDREIVYDVNQTNGILNNTVLSVFEDIDNNVWLGLDNGISYINLTSPVRVFNENSGKLGSVYTTAVLNGLLYLGTNQGLFYKKLSSNEAFKLVDGSRGQVWCLQVINKTLFCGHHRGSYWVSNENELNLISETPGCWSIQQMEHNTDLLIQGNYDGLYIIEKQNDEWKFKNRIEGFSNSSRSFEVLGEDIFVNHEYKGVFHLKVDPSFKEVRKVVVDTLLKGANSSITRYGDDILYAYDQGVFRYDKSTRVFEKDTLLSKLYSEQDYTSGRILPDVKDENFWMFTKNNLTLISPGNLSNIPKFRTFPITPDIRKDVVEFENIINIDGLNNYLIGTNSGYISADMSRLSVNDFEVSIDQISNGINKDHSASGSLVDYHIKGDFESDQNNLLISYYSPEYYKYLSLNYQFQLEGIYDKWSEWSSESSVFFENLPPGEYTFNVKSRIGDKVSTNTASYHFSIDKPWYFSNAMIAIYIAIVILFSIFMHNVYRSYYKKQQRELIEKNKQELALAKLQNEKEIIKIKNEKLEEDFQSKSKELAASTLTIVRKNELLTQIKEHLNKIEDKKALTPVIKVIDRGLSEDENWELFKEAFNNADSEFFQKLKKLHPELSPNDLKLCAYLRLNLSSKEISQLINISPKSVEIKRYRLRKKMNLDSNENLTDYILAI